MCKKKIGSSQSISGLHRSLKIPPMDCNYLSMSNMSSAFSSFLFILAQFSPFGEILKRKLIIFHVMWQIVWRKFWKSKLCSYILEKSDQDIDNLPRRYYSSNHSFCLKTADLIWETLIIFFYDAVSLIIFLSFLSKPSRPAIGVGPM